MAEQENRTAPAPESRGGSAAPRSSHGPRRGPQRRERRPRGRGGRFGRRRRRCSFCANKVAYIDYKKADALRSYLTDRGKIKPRRRTGTCAKHQRWLSLAIKRARHLALLPFVVQSSRPA
ncbi:MAG: 30S ribosomal protein S18 [Anaerolineales bacterium]|nr:MAG: 30S ribosomal protein S18 [Anaerolineales bacterium]